MERAPADREAGVTAARRDARRREVVEAALRVMLRDGPANASLRAIADELRSTVGVLTHQFASKDALVLAALEHLVGALFHDAVAAAARDTGPDRLERLLLRVLPTSQEQAERWRLWVGFLGQILADPALLDAERRGNRRFLRAVEDELAALRTAGRLPPDRDPATDARTLLALVDGLGIDAVLHPELFPPEVQAAAIRRHLAMLLAAPSG